MTFLLIGLKISIKINDSNFFNYTQDVSEIKQQLVIPEMISTTFFFIKISFGFVDELLMKNTD